PAPDRLEKCPDRSSVELFPSFIWSQTSSVIGAVVQRRLAVSRNSAMANHSATVRKLHPKETAGSRAAWQVARQVSDTIGLDFFQSMVQHLGHAIAADYV